MDPLVFLRLDETTTGQRPIDDGGALGDLDVGGTFGIGASNMPPVVDGVTGRARSFGGAAGQHGIAARDIVAGTTLLNRNLSIQSILTWDAALASAVNPASIIARGIGTAAAEYHPFALEIRLVSAALKIGELRWLWQDTAGVLKTQIGGHFQGSDGWMMLTATRRWVSSTEVVLRYYLADELLAEVPSVDGVIGGGTTGLTQLGMRFVGAGPTRWYGGKIDQLRILDRELAPEEIAMTWERMTKIQPRAYQLLRDLHPPGMPISSSPSASVQRETRIWGDALGYAAAQAENVRRNFKPSRAYGPILEEWETVTKQPARIGDDLDKRRKRVTGFIRRRAGVSPPGVREAVRELADTDPSNLSVVAFDQTTYDAFATLNEYRWTYEPAAKWTIVANALRVLGVDAGQDWLTWYTAQQSVGGSGRDGHIFAKLTPTTITNNSEVGLMFLDRSRGHAFLFGYQRDNGGVLRLVTETMLYGVLQGSTIRNSPAGLNPVWMHLHAQNDFTGLTSSQTRFDARWSFAAANGPFTEALGIVAGFRGFDWAGMYSRRLTAAAPSVDVAIDDCYVRQPYGLRAYNFYVYRNPALAGRPDIEGARHVIRELKQMHTEADFVLDLDAKYDDANTTFDWNPMGGV